jgi:hypothetical protein
MKMSWIRAPALHRWERPEKLGMTETQRVEKAQPANQDNTDRRPSYRSDIT